MKKQPKSRACSQVMAFVSRSAPVLPRSGSPESSVISASMSSRHSFVRMVFLHSPTNSSASIPARAAR